MAKEKEKKERLESAKKNLDRIQKTIKPFIKKKRGYNTFYNWKME